MLSLMQKRPLLYQQIITRRDLSFESEVVTRSVKWPIHRANYGQIRKRTLKAAQRLSEAKSSSRSEILYNFYINSYLHYNSYRNRDASSGNLNHQ